MSVLKGYKGKWKVDITDGIDPLTGEIKRHRKSGFTSRKEAVQYEADYRLNKLHQVQIKDKISVSHLYSLVQQHRYPAITNMSLSFLSMQICLPLLSMK